MASRLRRQPHRLSCEGRSVNEEIQKQPSDDFGQFLIRVGLLTEAQLTTAVAHMQASRISLERALVDLETLDGEQVTRARAQFLDIPYVCIKDVTIDRSVLSMVDPSEARDNAIVPFGRKPDGTLRIAVTDWNDEVRKAAAEIAYSHGIKIAPALATTDHVMAAIDKHYASRAAREAEV